MQEVVEILTTPRAPATNSVASHLRAPIAATSASAYPANQETRAAARAYYRDPIRYPRPLEGTSFKVGDTVFGPAKFNPTGATLVWGFVSQTPRIQVLPT